MDNSYFDRLKKPFLSVEPLAAKDKQPKLTSRPNKQKRVPSADVVQSRRNDDMSAEAQLGVFLDTYLYNDFPHKDSFSNIERVHSKAEQLAGVDVRFTSKDDTVYNVDEKAQLYYINKDLPTFAFEIQFLREGKETLGWLCNGSLLTDLYLLIWPFATQDTPKGICWDRFTKADCLLVQKDRVLSLLEKKGLTPEKMLADASSFRKIGRTGKVAIPGVKGIYYYASDPHKYQEAPINIIIAKKKLLGIAQRRYIVTQDGVETQ